MARRKNCPASLMSAYVRESESGSSRQEGVVGVGLESTLKGGAFSMRTITSVGVLSVAKIMGAIYAVIGLILLPFFLLASLIGSMAGGHDNRPRSNWWPDFWTFRANLLWCPGFRLRCDRRVSV